jgi:hypothetical protein
MTGDTESCHNTAAVPPTTSGVSGSGFCQDRAVARACGGTQDGGRGASNASAVVREP